METEKRLLLVLAFAILAVVLYQKFFAAPGTMKEKVVKEQAAKVEKAPVNSARGKAKAKVAQAKGEKPQIPGTAEASQGGQEGSSAGIIILKPLGGKVQEVTFSFPLYKVTLSSRGGVMKSYLLVRYKDDDGYPMELVGDTPYFSYYIPGNKGITEALDRSVYKVKVEEGKDKKKVTFLLEMPGKGVMVEKVFTFYPNYRFDVQVKTSIPGISGEGMLIGPRIAPKDRESHYSFSGPLVYNGKKAIEVKLKKKRQATYTGFVWTSLQSLYFTASLVPKGPAEVTIWKGATKNEYYLALIPKKGELSFWSFMGPKDYSLLKSYGVGLEENIRFGMFKILAKPALEILKFIYKYVHNYGWAIIILTILIKIVFHPLTVKGYKSMNKMQELQPYIKQLKETYKDDPQALNKEMMALYKKHKVNPMGGCLPMLLQIPVFFALYKVLMVAIELRHAPFIFWITDLSAKDPYYITPILMGVTMLIQQKMTPMGDPTQAKMMMLMPIVFTFIFINFPSGLVIYWLVNNIITIFEQYLIKKVYT